MHVVMLPMKMSRCLANVVQPTVRDSSLNLLVSPCLGFGLWCCISVLGRFLPFSVFDLSVDDIY